MCHIAQLIEMHDKLKSRRSKIMNFLWHYKQMHLKPVNLIICLTKSTNPNCKLHVIKNNLGKTKMSEMALNVLLVNCFVFAILKSLIISKKMLINIMRKCDLSFSQPFRQISVKTTPELKHLF